MLNDDRMWIKTFSEIKKIKIKLNQIKSSTTLAYKFFRRLSALIHFSNHKYKGA